MHAFDRQTDGQTDTFLIASPRWHSMQRGKKTTERIYTKILSQIYLW